MSLAQVRRGARAASRRRTAGSSSGPGWNIPAGSLDHYRAARANSATGLAEFVVAGDSTWAGQTLSGAYYSPATRLRALFAAAGYTDGGHGHNNGVNDTPAVSGDTASGVVLNTYATTGSSAVAMPGETIFSNAVGDQWTYTVTGSHLRLYYNAWNQLSGAFSYAIDGGAAVTVNPGNAVTLDPQYILVDLPGRTDAQHTVVIRNVGGAPIPQPTVTGQGPFGSGGTIPGGTYYYGVTTAINGGGETAPVVVGPYTIGAGQKFYVQANAIGVGRTLNVYRGTTSNPATMGLVASGAGSGSSMEVDDTGATAPGVAPPTTGTAVDTSRVFVNTNVEAMRSAGIVLHNESVRGQVSDYTNAGNGHAGAKRLALMLGLTLPSDSASASAGTPSSVTGMRHPSLAIFALGINDADTTALNSDAVEFINAARAANCDPLMCIQHFDYSAAEAPAKIAAVKSAATSLGAAWVDVGAGGALGPFSGWAAAGYGGSNNNPHLTQLAYQTQGQYVWDHVLSQ